MNDDLNPKPFWKLPDYMQAIENVLRPTDMPIPSIEPKLYEECVRRSLRDVKIAIANAEAFLTGLSAEKGAEG